VFEQMSKTRAAFALVARTNIVVDGDGHDWHGMVFVKDDPQSVG
jgi:hypothetical protein